MTNKRRTPQEWQHIIEAQQASDFTIAEFCQQHALNPSTFYLQRKKLAALSLPPSNSDWLPFENQVHHEQVSRQWQIVLTLPNGVVLNMSTDR
ncbi:IS66 family insertion sequence element accessory protein TnpB [Paraglaciecola sp.]|uniref:IS66 family insertion sequence element accessory protein TnpA n=1 Tax=Paraglaciecola sp. TaxID=1920173 RepID=UPI0030F3FB17